MATTIDCDGLVTLGATDADGVRWRLIEFDGWEGSPAPTLDVVQNPRQDWASAGESFLTARYMAPRGIIVAPTPALLNAAIDRLNAAIAKSDRPYTVAQNGDIRWLNARRADEVRTTKINDQIAQYALQLVATDGRKLHPELTGSTLLPTTLGGLTVPFTAPLIIPATQITGQVSLENVGNTAGPVRLRISGPCTGPVIEHTTANSTRRLVFASSLVLAAGEWLDIDMDARTVLANGQSNRRMYVTSAAWSAFEPGGNTWAFTAAVYDAASQLTVFASPADE